MAQTLSEIKSLLATHGLHPRHRLGQNFLHDANQMARILDAAALKDDELVLEVGPGTGALSERLLDAGVRLAMVEIDRELEPILQQRVLDHHPDRARLLIADVLAGKHDINPAVWQLLNEVRKTGTPDPARRSVDPLAFKLIANLPYNVASPLLANLVLDHPQMTLAVVMIQREVADRLTAEPGGKEYGPLGILVQAACHVERIAVLTPGCFWPAPKVDSAVVRLRRRKVPLAPDLKALSDLLHTLFSKRRKQIGSILGRDAVLPAAIDSTARPEQLTIDQFVGLAASVPLKQSLVGKTVMDRDTI